MTRILAACLLLFPMIAAAATPRLPWGVKAKRRDDGGYDLTARASAPLRAEGMVVDTRTPLDAAAKALCPAGHDMTTPVVLTGSIQGTHDGRIAMTSAATLHCRTEPPAPPVPPATPAPATEGDARP